MLDGDRLIARTTSFDSEYREPAETRRQIRLCHNAGISSYLSFLHRDRQL